MNDADLASALSQLDAAADRFGAISRARFAAHGLTFGRDRWPFFGPLDAEWSDAASRLRACEASIAEVGA